MIQKILLMGMGSLSWQRGSSLLQDGRMPGVAGAGRSPQLFPVSFENPRLRAAWWTSVATGLRAHEHRVWSEHSLPTSLEEMAPLWSRFKDIGWATARIGWPAENGSGEENNNARRNG